MSQTLLSVLVIEDDDSVAQALKEVLSRHKCEVEVFKNPKDVVEKIKSHHYHLAFIDCMVPHQNGVDFVMENLGDFERNDTEVILMSGIFTDRAFIKESLQKTKAKAFLPKPFEVDQVVSFVKQASAVRSQKLPSRYEFLKAYATLGLDPKQKRESLIEVEELDSYDLLNYLYLAAEYRLSGYIYIEFEKGLKTTLTLSNGVLIGIDLDDKNTKIGSLLVKYGYVTAEDLNEVLNNPQGSSRLGQRLIQANKMSPHAFDYVFVEQLKARLQSILLAEKIKVQFSLSEVDQTIGLEKEDLSHFAFDYFMDQVPEEFLQSYYQNFITGKVKYLSPSVSQNPFLQRDYFKKQESFLAGFSHGVTIEQILQDKSNPDAIRLLHLLVLKGIVVLSLPEVRAGDKQKSAPSKEDVSYEIETLKAQAISQLEDIKNALLLGQTKKALPEFDHLSSMNINIPDFEIVRAWVMVIRLSAIQNKNPALREIEMVLNSIDNDDKQSLTYNYVYGLFLKAKGDMSTAQKYFDKCLEIDPNHIGVRREASRLRAELSKKKNQNILTMDLQQALTGFFKKK